MKKFHQYLSESERTYNYRIKILGDVPSGFIGELKEKLKQFDIAKMSDKKTTPVQHAYRSDFTIAGGRTPPAKTTNDLPQGNTSPMTNIKRQPKPATGYNTRG